MKQLKMLTETTTNKFGVKADFEFSRKNHDVLIIAYNKGYGLIPCALCLPHHVYTKTLNEFVAKYPDIKSFTIIPANSKDYIDIAEVITV